MADDSDGLMSLSRAMLDHPGLATPRENTWRQAMRSAVSGLIGAGTVSDAERSMAGPPRDAEQRRGYFGDPHRYFAEVLGWRLTFWVGTGSDQQTS
ncbi:MAG: hypothetical protein ABI629_16305, partial [bacterium]